MPIFHKSSDLCVPIPKDQYMAFRHPMADCPIVKLKSLFLKSFQLASVKLKVL